MGQGVALLHTLFAQDLCWAKQNKAVVRMAQVTISGQSASRRFSRRKQDLSVWLKALSKSRVWCFGSHRRMVWTTASQRFFGPAPMLRRSEAKCHVFGNSGQQGFRSETSDLHCECFGHSLEEQGWRPPARGCRRDSDNWTWDVAFCHYPDNRVQGTHHLVSATWKASLGMLCVKARRSVSAGSVARQFGAVGRSFLLAKSPAGGGG